jgi:hypothetical protein
MGTIMDSYQCRLVRIPFRVLERHRFSLADITSPYLSRNTLSEVTTNLPEGFRVERLSSINLERLAVEIIISHPSFSEVIQGQTLTEFPLEFAEPKL